MRSEYSEFTYGMALAYEAVDRLGGAAEMRAAPVMPSLRDERTGGYDLHIDSVYAGLFLQFKRPEFLVGPRAGERALFGGDYYRFALRNSSKSPQHATLCSLQRRTWGANVLVAYASGIFWRSTELNNHFQQQRVCDHSVFVNPLQVGEYAVDTQPGHSVAYTGQHDVTRCSEPSRLGTTSWEFLQGQMVGLTRPPRAGVPLRLFLLNLLGLSPQSAEEIDIGQLQGAVMALCVQLDVNLLLLGTGPTPDLA